MMRDEAFNLVKQHVSNKNLIKHMLATEAVMGSLARHLGENETEWKLAGLLHDLDYDKTVDHFERHGLLTAELLSSHDISEAVIQAIKSHPGHFPRESAMDKALYAADPVTGLIVAAALMHPSKKLKNVDVTFVERRFQEKRFAAGADRDQIRSCETLGLGLSEFIALSLRAMQEIDGELGL
ncbi:HDIG domain-containing protein [bacterium]|nr:HDIG domain-containing protein [bacterium]